MADQDTGDIQYFAQQKKIYPRRVFGRFRQLKWAVMIMTLGIYYFVPFIRFDRGPNAPDQAVLIDMPNRKAYWFWIEIWPQEVYILTGILILAAVALFFVTSMFGRVWCGYFCPQTVWTDLYVWVERLVQGDRFSRQKLDESPLSLEKIWKKGLTHFIWLGIAFWTGGAFVLYFNDAPTLLHDFITGNLSSTVWGFIGGLTFSTYLMAGYAREQVCTYMCPYARFQSAMFDPDTLIIGYDPVRGEPRGKHKKGDPWDGRGHCVDCTACVQVCPMGIDIRKGLQMECIACGLCIDACDEIMAKVELPKGLIRYDTDRNFQLLAEGKPEQKFHLYRARTFYYVAIMALVGGVMLNALIGRKPLELHVLHDRNPLYVTLSDGTVRNGYDIKILNKTNEDKVFSVEISGLKDAALSVKTAGDITADSLPVESGGIGAYHVFVTAPKDEEIEDDVVFTLTDKKTGETSAYKGVFIKGDMSQ